MKSLKRRQEIFLFITIAVFLLALVLCFFMEIKLLMTLALMVVLFVSYIFYKEKVGQEIIIAFLFALVVTSYYTYEYTTFNFSLGRINLFPLVCWTFGLVLLREVYERIHIHLRLFLTCFIYWVGLFALEYWGYHSAGIQLNSNFPDLFNLGLMHAPVGMKFFYLFAGPVYLLVTDYLKLKYA